MVSCDIPMLLITFTIAISFDPKIDSNSFVLANFVYQALFINFASNDEESKSNQLLFCPSSSVFVFDLSVIGSNFFSQGVGCPSDDDCAFDNHYRDYTVLIHI